MTISFKVSDVTKEKLIEHFKYLKRDKTPAYAIFQADEEDTVVTLYESGKVVFQGVSADVDANYWKETEKILTGSYPEEKEKKEKKEDEDTTDYYFISSIGSDEVGTGDYFGPIVVTASYVAKDNVDFLLDLHVKDSKKFTDDKILEIVPKIIKKIPYKTYILNNKDYNNNYANYNMNAMKAILHNKVLYEVKDMGYSYDYIVVDQFENPSSYFKHISKSNKQVKDILFLTKAEDQCLSVACSSLISRYIFLKEMDKLSRDVGINLPKGANPIVDKVATDIVNKYGIDKLKDICKYNFKNTDKILNSK